MWETIGQVTSIFSLTAFIAAVIAAVLNRQLKNREQLIKSAPEADRQQLIEAVLDRFSVDTANLTREQRYHLAQEVIRRRSERLRWGLMTFAILFVVSILVGVYAFVIVDQGSGERFYTVRVIPVAPGGQPSPNTSIEVSVDALVKQVGKSWELEIPPSKLPPDRQVEIWLREDTAFLTGHASLTLDEARQERVRIELEKDHVDVGGLLVDENNQPLKGARVIVLGYPNETFETGSDGQFLLDAHAADGEVVHLRAEKQGYQPAEEYPYAGERSVRMTLDKLP